MKLLARIMYCTYFPVNHGIMYMLITATRSWLNTIYWRLLTSLHGIWKCVEQSPPKSEFTQNVLHKIFSRESVPLPFVMDSYTHVSAKHLYDWLKGLDCRQLSAASRHP